MSAARTSSRRRARELALQALYALDLASEDGQPGGADVREAFEAVAAHFEAPHGAREFAWELVARVTERGKEIDEHITACSSNWRLDRMAAVDRNVLRLGTCELAFSDTPAAVVVDEAVELARRFGDDPSPAFVNGVLDAVARALRPGRPGAGG